MILSNRSFFFSADSLLRTSLEKRHRSDTSGACGVVSTSVSRSPTFAILAGFDEDALEVLVELDDDVELDEELDGEDSDVFSSS